MATVVMKPRSTLSRSQTVGEPRTTTFPSNKWRNDMFKITIRSAAILLAAGAAMSLVSQEVNAQCGYGGSSFGISSSGFSLNIGTGYRGNSGYYGARSYGTYGGGCRSYNRGVSISGYRPSYYRHPAWHNTTRLDYHPGRTVRHRSHYVPGHYDIYRTRHYHH